MNPALREVIGLYGPQVQAACRRICADFARRGEGVVSQVFWELWNSATNMILERGSLRAYLLTLARSRAMDRERANAALLRKTKAGAAIGTIAEKHELFATIRVNGKS